MFQEIKANQFYTEPSDLRSKEVHLLWFFSVGVNMEYTVRFFVFCFPGCVIPYIYSKIHLLSFAWVYPSQATTWQLTLWNDFFLYTIMIPTAKSCV